MRCLSLARDRLMPSRSSFGAATVPTARTRLAMIRTGGGAHPPLAARILKRAQRFVFANRALSAVVLAVSAVAVFGLVMVWFRFRFHASGHVPPPPPPSPPALDSEWSSVVARASHAPASTLTRASDRCMLVTTSDGDALCAPYFFVLGAFKAGTTSLYSYLSHHPGIALKNQSDTATGSAPDDPEHHPTADDTTTAAANPRRATNNIVRVKETNFFAGYNRTLPAGARAGGGLHPTGAEYEMARLAGRNLSAEIARAAARQPHSLADYVRLYFPSLHPADGRITGEASPAYLFDPYVPAKLRRTFPHARLIALLREPVERAYSRWAHLVGLRCAIEPDEHVCSPAGTAAIFDRVVSAQLPQLKRCLAESNINAHAEFILRDYELFTACMHHANAVLVGAELRRLDVAAGEYLHDIPALTAVVRDVLFTRSCIELDFLTHSIYLFQLKNWHSHFPREQLLVLISEDLFGSGVEVMNRVSTHLGLAAFDWGRVVTGVKYNVGIVNKKRRAEFVRESAGAAGGGKSKQHPISAETRRVLSEFFNPFNEQLSRYLGVELAAVWNKP